MGVRELTILEFRVHVLKIEILSHVGQQNFHIRLRKSLAHADTQPTVEWTESGWVALFALWCETEFARRVKPFWEELVRSLPLVLIDMKAVEMIHDVVSFFEVILT